MNLFSGQKTGHMAAHVYTPPSNQSDPDADGPRLWERFESEIGDNYAYKRERRNIRQDADLCCCDGHGPRPTLHP